MPRILTTHATVLCPHGGQGTSIPSQPPKGYVQGGAVLLDGDTGIIAGCVNQIPCVSYLLQSMRLNSSLIDGRPVMLVTDLVQSNAGFPLTLTESHPIHDSTTPAPLPAGAAPRIPPELTEDDQPQAQVAPSRLPFSLSGFGGTGQPLALPFVFTLTSAHPRRFTVWQISSPNNVNRDVTAGVPPAVVVAPAGGGWSSSPLAVSLTVSGAYASTLAVGDHTFALTAINHRGLFALAEATVEVQV
jgi:hypothetical protein